jgi:hypothetical protein
VVAELLVPPKMARMALLAHKGPAGARHGRNAAVRARPISRLHPSLPLAPADVGASVPRIVADREHPPMLQRCPWQVPLPLRLPAAAWEAARCGTEVP